MTDWLGSVLIVDDDGDTRALFRAALETAGMVVIEAGTASDALVALRASRPRVLVSDLPLAEGHGGALCRAVRADPALRPTRIIVVTALTGSAARAALVGVDADAILTKPVDLDQFTATCRGVALTPRRGARVVSD